MKWSSACRVLALLPLAVALAAQTSTHLNNATLSTGLSVNVNVDVTFPAGTTATLRFVLIRGGVVIGQTESASATKAAGQVFVVYFGAPPGGGLPTPQKLDTVRAELTCSNGDTATSPFVL